MADAGTNVKACPGEAWVGSPRGRPVTTQRSEGWTARALVQRRLLTAVAGATLVTGLVLGGSGIAPAIVATVIFRVVSYWLPLPLGVAASHQLRAQLLL